MDLNNDVNQTHMVRTAMLRAEARAGNLKAALDGVIHAWEALPKGDYPAWKIDAWLNRTMKPAIDAARRAQ